MARELDLLVEDTMAPTLAPFGFRRRGDDFLRTADEDLVQVVSIQRRDNEVGTYVTWTLNIAVHAHELRDLRGFPRLPETPDASGCFLSIRIADLLSQEGSTREFWYELATVGSLEQRTRELLVRSGTALSPLELRYEPWQPETARAIVRADLEQAVVPHLHTVRSRRDLYAFSKRTIHAGPLDWLALELGLGEVARAKQTWNTNLPDRDDIRAEASAASVSTSRS